MSKEHVPPHRSGSVGSRILSATMLAVGAALVVSAVLTAPHDDLAGAAIFSAVAVVALIAGLVLARRSGLFAHGSWSGRSWSELLTPGGPVRSPFEWIRVCLAATLGSALILLVALALAAFARSGVAFEASFGQGVITAVGILALIFGIAAILLGAFALVALAVGVIGLGLRSGASSMSLRDWVSMDKRG
jgi:hypothetical protein